MEIEVLKALLTLLGGAFLGGLLKSLWDVNTNFAKDLWAKRYESYTNLWKLTAILPKFPKAVDVKYEALLETSEKMRDWYFSGGGMLFSENSKKYYFNLQEALLGRVNGQNLTDRISDNDYTFLQGLFSHLRTELTQDLLSRSRGGFWTALKNAFK